MMLILLLPTSMLFAGTSGYGECASHVFAEEATSISESECLLTSTTPSHQMGGLHQNKGFQKIFTTGLPHQVINKSVPKCLIFNHIGTSTNDNTKSLDVIASCKSRHGT